MVASKSKDAKTEERILASVFPTLWRLCVCDRKPALLCVLCNNASVFVQKTKTLPLHFNSALHSI